MFLFKNKFKYNTALTKELLLASSALTMFVLQWQIINIFFGLLVVSAILFKVNERTIALFAVLLILLAAFFAAYGLREKAELIVNYSFVLLFLSMGTIMFKKQPDANIRIDANDANEEN